MSDAPSYQVLARKYRPATFADLVGQDDMVRTLANAFKADRIAQAFMMTGIRGTGKTSTARIIAKGMNCIGPDGTGNPTTEPCGVCEHCQAIAEGRHVDVIEMDAASNTGVDDMRAQVIDTVAYAPSSARFKIYIIDEVHMLSRSAFNALLKTLEEPPRHVKFIFATTEIRKVPVTVLSRCQRFDLRRIEPEVMIAMLQRIASAEGGTVEDGALALIARASEGSARDATSLLDQALGQAAGNPVTAENVRAMLGLADRGRVLDLFDMVMRGNASAALEELASQYADGADPLAVLRDLAEVTHWISIAKITPDAADDPAISPDERDRGRQMAEALPMRALARGWQMLLKAMEEVANAPNAMMAAEMAIIRLTHVADLPSPEDLMKRLRSSAAPGTGGATTTPGGNTGQGAPTAIGTANPQMGESTGPSPTMSAAVPTARAGLQASALPPARPRVVAGGAQAQTAPAASAPAQYADPEVALGHYHSFERVLELISANRDMKLQVEVETGVRLVSYRPGRIEFTPSDVAAPDLAPRLAQRLQQWTGVRWGVSVSDGSSAPTIAEARDAVETARRTEAEAHPMVAAVLAAFPKAKVTHVRAPEDLMQEAQHDALAEVEDEWDPFEDG
ncbi:MAG: DNA polymerase III subunit gamma/tau [Oceanicola sp.]|nr:DNA polymerase III subunit gamma/tau [Oceanicola sp.]